MTPLESSEYTETERQLKIQAVPENTGFYNVPNAYLQKVYPELWSEYVTLAEAFQIDLEATKSTILLKTLKATNFATVDKVLEPIVSVVDNRLCIRWGDVVKPVAELKVGEAEDGVEQEKLTKISWNSEFKFIESNKNIYLAASRYSSEKGLPGELGIRCATVSKNIQELSLAYNNRENKKNPEAEKVELARFFMAIGGGNNTKKMREVLSKNTEYTIELIGCYKGKSSKDGQEFLKPWMKVKGIEQKIRVTSGDLYKFIPSTLRDEKEMVVNWNIMTTDEATNPQGKPYLLYVMLPSDEDVSNSLLAFTGYDSQSNIPF